MNQRGTPSYDDIQNITDPNDLIAAAVIIETDMANGEVSQYDGEVALATLEARATEVYANNAAEIAEYDDLATADTNDEK